MVTTSIPFVTAEAVADTLSPAEAVAAIEEALRAGVEPAADFRRQFVELRHGQLILMPAQSPSSAGVKVVTVSPDNPNRGLPRIQAVYVLFDARTLTPRALLDGAALTTLRTPAVSLAAVKPALLAKDTPLHVTVFGGGPQATGHAATLADVTQGHRAIASITYVVRNPSAATLLPGHAVVEANSPRAADAVRRADVIVCATSASDPVFDSADTKPDVIVMAVGSHEPGRREVDTRLAARAQVIVEDRDTALREAGDVVIAMAESGLRADDLIPMRDIVTGATALRPHEAVFFKGSGMSWQDIVVADAVAARLAS